MRTKKAINKFFELDKNDRKMYMLQLTMINTIIVGSIKLLFGVLYSSIWFFINAFFYAILSFSKYRSIRDYRIVKKIESEEEIKKIKYKNYLYNGWLLILLGVAYCVANVLIIKTGKITNNIGGYLVYVVALIAFSSMITAIISLTQYRSKDDPIVAAACQGNVAKALTTIVLTQVVLLDQFGPKSSMIVNFDGGTGIAIGFIIILLGIRMVVKIARADEVLD